MKKILLFTFILFLFSDSYSYWQIGNNYNEHFGTAQQACDSWWAIAGFEGAHLEILDHTGDQKLCSRVRDFDGALIGSVSAVPNSGCGNLGPEYVNDGFDCIIPPPPLPSCFGWFDDLSPDPGNQCVCGDGFLPNFSAGGVADCDGRNKQCAPGQQTVQTSIDGHLVNSCQNTSVCNPETDPNGCQIQGPTGCISTDPNDPCIGDGLVNNQPPQTCPDGYYFSGSSCLPITSKSTNTNTNTGISTTSTTVNNGDSSLTTYTSTSSNSGDISTPGGPTGSGDAGTGDGDGNGDTGTGDGDGDGDSTASGGGSCASAPSCSGDAIQCAILHQEWLVRCASLDNELNNEPDSFDLQSQLNTLEVEMETAKTDMLSLIDTIQGEVQSTFDFSVSSSGGGSLPTNVVNIFGSNIDISIEKYSSNLSIIGSAIIALSLLLAAVIIMKV